jgi:hypothetical protein
MCYMVASTKFFGLIFRILTFGMIVRVSVFLQRVCEVVDTGGLLRRILKCFGQVIGHQRGDSIFSAWKRPFVLHFKQCNA